MNLAQIECEIIAKQFVGDILIAGSDPGKTKIDLKIIVSEDKDTNYPYVETFCYGFQMSKGENN